MASSPVIPREQLSAYQRWELGSFDPPKTSRPPPAATQTVEQIHAQARSDGYSAGHGEGFEAGRREALAQMALRTARMDELVAGLATDLKRLDSELATDVVQLALTVARKMVGAALEARPEIVQTCVEEALRQMAHNYGPVHLTCHPDDAELVRDALKASARTPEWSLKEDPTVSRGGCRLETTAGEVDATVETRWQRTTAALGPTRDWIAGSV